MKEIGRVDPTGEYSLMWQEHQALIKVHDKAGQRIVFHLLEETL